MKTLIFNEHGLRRSRNQQSGINMVDLMMWLVIAALLLAAAIQGIGYYQKASYLYQMQNDVEGAGTIANGVAANNKGIIDKAAADEALLEAKKSTGVVTTVEMAADGKTPYIRATHPGVTDKDALYLFDACKDTYKIGVNVVPKGGTPALDACGISATPPSSGGGTGTGTPGDIDGDGIPNASDPDIDGDGIPNASDPDVDGDGIPNADDTTPNGEVSTGGGGTTPTPTGVNYLASWGNDYYNQMGVAGASLPASRSNTPFSVTTGSLLDGKTVTAVSSAYAHGCAAADNDVYCWGYNDYMKLGDPAIGEGALIELPNKVVGLPAGTVTAVATSEKANCALISGSVYCWGGNDEGAVGINTSTFSESPHKVLGLDGKSITKLVAGYRFICAADAHDMYCWGRNNQGMIGNGTTTNALVPTVVSALSGKNITSIDAQGYTACAVADGTPWCWGANSDWAQIDPSYDDVLSPRAFDMSSMGGKTATSISVSEGAFCMIASDNNAYCWGNGYGGIFGNGNAGDVANYTPQKVALPGAVTSIEMGDYAACALSNGAVYCWGKMYYSNPYSWTPNDGNYSIRALDTSGVLSGKTITRLSMGQDAAFVIYQ